MPNSAAQIVALSCGEAKCPGFIVQGGQYLNLVLKDLWLHRDLKVNLKTQPLLVQANSNGPFNLETDYQRTYDLWYYQQVNNFLPLFLKQGSLRRYDSEFKDPSISDYPYEFATDLSTIAQTGSGGAGYLYIYPQSSGQISLTHRYMQQQPEITTPETSATVPWFIDQDYLVKATAARLMGLVDDDRITAYEEKAEAMLRIHLIMAADDEQSVVKSVALDPWRFRTTRVLRPTKQTG